MSHHKAIIVDLDGTLSDCAHRRHHVEGEKKDFDKFHSEMTEDQVHWWCDKLLWSMRRTGYQVLLVTGRPEKYRARTIMWLRYNGVEYDHLFMRANEDWRLDALIKKEIYEKKIAPDYNILFCVDDRKQVVDMWRSLGLTCLQCAEGNF